MSAIKKLLRLSLEQADEMPERVFLKAIVLLSYIVFGALENVSNRIGTDELVEVLKTELRELYTVVDRILTDLRNLTICVPTMDMLLSPVIAANIALAATAKLYDKAHLRLDKLLSNRTAVSPGYTTLPLASHSELLWSQLIQLRCSLPTRLATSSKSIIDLPKDISECHKIIACRVSGLGVFPHHVSLANDWNIVRPLVQNSPSQKKKNKEATEAEEDYLRICTVLHNDGLLQQKKRNIKFHSLPGEKFSLRRSRGEPLQKKSPLPRSLLVAGSLVSELNLCNTGLSCLPLNFGLYFPMLKVCLGVC
jgi:hypothetical protein